MQSEELKITVAGRAERPSDDHVLLRFDVGEPDGILAQGKTELIREKVVELAMLIRDHTPACSYQDRAMDALDDVLGRSAQAIRCFPGDEHAAVLNDLDRKFAAFKTTPPNVAEREAARAILERQAA